ncbi:tripartite tricarboxylate transporter substrate binding protein [Roseomonas sp. CCTCC AB2023176]|uniref:tripartite tricarboxylate transporter substrate binding protein n=1 Tax=Roseomonas sp. CCTCC AB2023176 TaxID=3342640 RepID=UPI0035D7F9BE
MITRRRLAAAAAAQPVLAAVAAQPILVAATLPLAAPAIAQENFPSRPVQVIIPYPPGNAIDLLVRVLAAAMQPHLGQTVVVLNREGAAAAVGSSAAARATPDGYTLLFAPALVASVLPVAQSTSGLRTDSFRPICQVFNNSMALVVKPDSPIRDLRTLQAMAKERPGRLTYGTLGVTSIPHLAMVQWLQAAGVEMEHVPYRADAQVMTEVQTGRIDVGSIVLGSAAGRNDMRILTNFDAQRHPDFPDAPTAIEQGFEVAPASFGGLMAPANTPPDRIARIEAACTAAAAGESYREAARRGSQPANFFLDRPAFERRLQEDIAVKARLLQGMVLN